MSIKDKLPNTTITVKHTPSQKALILAAVHLSADDTRSHDLATENGLHVGLIHRASTLIKHAPEKTIDAIMSGEKSVTTEWKLLRAKLRLKEK